MVFNSLFGFQPRESEEQVASQQRGTASSEDASRSPDGGLAIGLNRQKRDDKPDTERGGRRIDDPISQAEARILNSISGEAKNAAQEGITQGY